MIHIQKCVHSFKDQRWGISLPEPFAGNKVVCLALIGHRHIRDFFSLPGFSKNEGTATFSVAGDIYLDVYRAATELIGRRWVISVENSEKPCD
jgi:hypothetical protein